MKRLTFSCEGADDGEGAEQHIELRLRTEPPLKGLVRGAVRRQVGVDAEGLPEYEIICRFMLPADELELFLKDGA